MSGAGLSDEDLREVDGYGTHFGEPRPCVLAKRAVAEVRRLRQEIEEANILLDDLLVPMESSLDDRIQQMSTIHTATLQGEEIARHSLRSTIAALEQERDEMRAVVRAAVDRVTAICGPPMTRADFHETWTRLESAVDAYRKQTDKDPHE